MESWGARQRVPVDDKEEDTSSTSAPAELEYAIHGKDTMRTLGHISGSAQLASSESRSHPSTSKAKATTAKAASRSRICLCAFCSRRRARKPRAATCNRTAVDSCRVSIFSAVSTANGPVDGVGSDVADEARRDAHGGGSLPVRSSRNNANYSRIPRMVASWSRSIRVISSGEKAWGGGGGPGGTAENRADAAQGCAPTT
jgi:hypothetical protein